MQKKIHTIILLVTIALTAVLCNKKDDFKSDAVTDYMNLQVGKYVIYQLDSTVRKPFTDTERIVKSYQAKDMVEAGITDNMGRPGWRVVRYLRAANSTNELDWKPSSTYMVVAANGTLEVIENNFRFQKLKLPIKNDFNWKGNSYIDTYTSDQDWSWRFLDDWDYMYENVGESFSPITTAVDETLTVQQRDEILGTPNNIDSYSEYNFAKEVYGKGIGLIYKDFTHWIFQARTSVYPFGHIEGFAIKLRMISHN